MNWMDTRALFLLLIAGCSGGTGTPPPDAGFPDGGPGADTTAPSWPVGAEAQVVDDSRTHLTVEFPAATDDRAVTEYVAFVNGRAADVAPASGASRQTLTVSMLMRGIEYAVRIEARDAAGNTSTGGPEVVWTTTTLPPDPASIAPPLDPTGVTPLYESVEFLFTGDDPIQEDVSPGAFHQDNASLLFGEVRDRDGAPLPGVLVRVLGHPEFGYTSTRADGAYDLVIAGQDALRLTFERPGYLPVQRNVSTGWEERFVVEPVAMTELSTVVTEVDLSSASEPQVARGTVEDEGDGPRQATVIFPIGTVATMRMPDGSETPLSRLGVRATEYTNGPDGWEALPGTMPRQIAYTYAVELSVDEAIQAGATSVEFSKPVFFYLENFIDLPIGALLPTGYYDRQRGSWVPSTDGRVVDILRIENGEAVLDVGGLGTEATAQEMEDLDLTQAERRRLGALYDAGQTLFRVPMDHFTAWDSNLPFRSDAESPPQPIAERRESDEPCEASGSIIQCNNQSLAEEFPVAGTGLTLRYQSDRTPARSDGFLMRVPLMTQELSENPPEDLVSIAAKIEVAGRVYRGLVSPGVPRDVVWERRWDGKDRYGRTLPTGAPIKTSVCYNFKIPVATTVGPGEGGGGGGGEGGRVGATQPQTFGIRGIPLGDDQRYVDIDRSNTVLSQCSSWVGYQPGLQWDPRGLGLQGLNLTGLQLRDRVAGELVQGNGTRRDADVGYKVFSLTGEGSVPLADGVALAEADLSRAFFGALSLTPGDRLLFSVGPFFTNQPQVYELDDAGIVQLKAGNGSLATDPSEHIEGARATDVPLGNVTDMATGTDGSIYILEENLRWVRRIDPSGTIHAFLGNGETPGTAPATPDAVDAVLSTPKEIAVADDGTLYVIDPGPGARSLIRVSTSGKARVEVADATNSAAFASALALDQDDTPYFLVRRFSSTGVERVTPQATLQPYWMWVPGQSDTEYGEGDQLLEAGLCGVDPGSLAFDADGTAYCAHAGFMAIATTDGRRLLIAGSGRSSIELTRYDGGAARIQRMPEVMQHLTIAASGTVYAIGNRQQIIAIGNENRAPGVAHPSLPRVHQFDGFGHHTHDTHRETGATLTRFEYESDGKLQAIVDESGNRVRIERPTADEVRLVAPFGETTILRDLNQDGYVDRILYENDPGGGEYALRYQTGTDGPTGLLTGLTDRAGNAWTFRYDAEGRLLADEGPDDRTQTLALVEQTEESLSDDEGRNFTEYAVTKTSASGLVTRHASQAFEGERMISKTISPHGSRPEAEATVTSIQEDRYARTVLLPGGNRIDVEVDQDPVYGWAARYTKRHVATLPSGRQYTTEQNRSVTRDGTGQVATRRHEVTSQGLTSVSEYDAESRRWAATTPAGRTATTELDVLGRVVRSEVPGRFPVRTSYDARGRVSIVRQGTGADERILEYIYDANADGEERFSPELVRDGLGDQVEYAFDALGRTVSSTLPDGFSANLDYDANGNLARFTPPSRPAHRYAYNGHDETTAYIPPALAGTDTRTRFTYDDDGRLVTTTLPDGRSINVEFEAGGQRVLSLTSDDGRYTLGYEPGTDRLSSMTTPSGLRFASEVDGMLVGRLAWSGNGLPTGSHGVSYTYNDRFNLVSTSAGTLFAGFEYDLDDLPIVAGSMMLVRDPDNGDINATQTGSVMTSRSYDGFGDLTSFSSSFGTEAFQFQDTRNTRGQITRRIETTDATVTTYDYRYDPVGRLVEVSTNGTVTHRYGHNERGSRTSFTEPGTSGTAEYDAQDRLLRHGNHSFAYNLTGQLTEKTAGTGPAATTTRYDYNAFGVLTQVDLPDGRTLEYLNDAAGRRVGKHVDGTLQAVWLYHDTLRPAAQLDADGNVEQLYVYATKFNVPDLIVAPGVTYRVITDTNGSVRRIVNTTTGEVVQAIDYDVFGKVIRDTQPGFQPFGYAGGHYDHDTKLVRFGARDYDPDIGRWTAKDPLLFDAGDLDLYNYAFGDPINFVDVTGGAPQWMNNFETWSNRTGFTDFVSGTGDVVSFGIGALLRNAILGDLSTVDECSAAYGYGELTGIVISIATGGLAGSGRAIGKAGVRAAADDVTRVFWSGGPKARDAAAAFARSNGGITLEMTTVGRALTVASKVLPRWVTTPLWTQASASFARGAAAQVTAFHGPFVRTTSVWAQTEFPILAQRGASIAYRAVW